MIVNSTTSALVCGNLDGFADLFQIETSLFFVFLWAIVHCFPLCKQSSYFLLKGSWFNCHRSQYHIAVVTLFMFHSIYCRTMADAFSWKALVSHLKAFQGQGIQPRARQWKCERCQNFALHKVTLETTLAFARWDTSWHISIRLRRPVLYLGYFRLFGHTLYGYVESLTGNTRSLGGVTKHVRS